MTPPSSKVRRDDENGSLFFLLKGGKLLARTYADELEFAPQPPILGEQENQSPPELGDLGGKLLTKQMTPKQPQAFW